MARYKAPVTVIVLNNHSYNNERNRIWNSAGRQFEAARDMTCYNGDPDVDFAKAADAFGVEGEIVKEPVAIKEALRARQNRDGRGPALSTRYPYQARRHWRGVGMASSLFRRRPAHTESVTMRTVLSGFLALVIASRSIAGPSAKCQSFAARRRARHRRGGVLAMPLSRHYRQNSRWRRGMAGLRQQHGAARRAIDAGGDRQSRGLSRRSISARALTCRRPSR